MANMLLVTCGCLAFGVAASAQTPAFSIPNSKLSIEVQLRHSHPLFAEYNRFVVLKSGQTELSKDYLYPDTGSGSLANLYRTPEGKYMLVDVNGFWFEIDPISRRIRVRDWHWEEPAPGVYVGCFAFGPEKETFGYFTPEAMKEQKVYQYKDPGRYKPSK